jgi:hypothetical protein
MYASIFATNRRAWKKAKRTSVFLNGEDVTLRCQSADSRDGWALLLKHNEAGRPYFDRERNAVATEVRHGSVRIERRA